MNVMRTSRESRQGLIDLVSFVNQDSLLMLEVGSYLGESSEIFLNTKSFSKIYCLDLWEGGYDSRDYASNNMNDIECKFLEFAKKYENSINVIKANSLQIPNLFEDSFFDIIYIDANHTYEGVKEDIKNCMPKVKKGGFIAGHDYGYDLYEVKQAVDELIGKPDKVFCDTSWIKKL